MKRYRVSHIFFILSRRKRINYRFLLVWEFLFVKILKMQLTIMRLSAWRGMLREELRQDITSDLKNKRTSK